MNVEVFVAPLMLLVMTLFYWMVINDGPQKIFAERRKMAEANAKANGLQLEQAKVELEIAKVGIEEARLKLETARVAHG